MIRLWFLTNSFHQWWRFHHGIMMYHDVSWHCHILLSYHCQRRKPPQFSRFGRWPGDPKDGRIQKLRRFRRSATSQVSSGSWKSCKSSAYVFLYDFICIFFERLISSLVGQSRLAQGWSSHGHPWKLGQADNWDELLDGTYKFWYNAYS